MLKSGIKIIFEAFHQRGISMDVIISFSERGKNFIFFQCEPIDFLHYGINTLKKVVCSVCWCALIQLCLVLFPLHETLPICYNSLTHNTQTVGCSFHFKILLLHHHHHSHPHHYHQYQHYHQ